MGQSRDERIARNEAAFRALNEVLVDKVHARRAATAHRVHGFVCECGNDACADVVQVIPEQYEQVRRDPMLFLLHPGHEAEDVETVVQRAEGYVVVRKHENVGEIARQTDPRRNT